jgi:hypothetical protein
LATRPALADKEALAVNPWFEQVLPVFSGAVARPSTILKGNYSQFASSFFDNVNKVLNNEEPPEQALRTIEAAAHRFVH